MNRSFILFASLLVGLVTGQLPTSYRIYVPYHRQITEYACGDASLQMTLDYWHNNFEVNQYSIMDVVRTTVDEGTLSLDMVRGCHFSSISSAAGVLFPNFTLHHGYHGNPIGLAAFWHDDEKPWLEEIKALIAQDIPVLTLMHYEVNGENDGHYRVLVGYDDTNGTITMNDAWDRDGNPRIVNWSYNDFIQAWNYTEQYSPRTKPFFGVAAFKWQIESSVNKVKVEENTGFEISIQLTYPCPQPFDCNTFPANNVIVSLEIPTKFTEEMYVIQSQTQNINIGSLPAGTSKTVSWVLQCLSGDCTGNHVIIQAKGIIAGELPWTYWNEHFNYPPYEYIDLIGSDKVLVPIA